MMEEHPWDVRFAQVLPSGTQPSGSLVSSMLRGGPMEYALHIKVGAGDLPDGFAVRSPCIPVRPRVPGSRWILRDLCLWQSLYWRGPCHPIVYLCPPD